ncbi:globin [Hydrogenimonas thermophila]|uniref:Hemoglobin n=1 Tax=Hydrogenimonas thermophila TaxID=223786 RepID=A0A1I5LCG1_9BACT|nr:globin [Hydrogenimonas thermophila]SFO94401.1 hemoglobin [Hydrogenimonas thermophila]
MNYTITPISGPGFRPPVTKPDPAFLQAIGEEGMRALVSRFYDLLVQSEIKHLFPTTPEGLEEAKRNSADFFIQICGGYPYFNERRGAPMMGKRHQPFAIDAKARVIWLENFALALEPVEAPEELKQSFWNYLDIFSAWMINR